MLFAAEEQFGGWMQLLLQGGAFALLAYIVVQLAPRLMSESRRERENREANFAALINTMQEKFETRNQILASSIVEQTRRLVAEMEKQTAMFTNTMDKVCKADCINYSPKHKPHGPS